jgi:hypothetical protein
MKRHTGCRRNKTSIIIHSRGRGDTEQCVKPTPGCPLEVDVYLCMGLSGWDLRTLASSVTMSSALEVELVRRSRVPRDLSSSDVILGVWRENS